MSAIIQRTKHSALSWFIAYPCCKLAGVLALPQAVDRMVVGVADGGAKNFFENCENWYSNKAFSGSENDG